MKKVKGEKTITMKKRVALWDNIKFAMIILMVIGHFVDVFAEQSHTFRSIYLFIYSFHMPMMIFVSGLFYSKKNTSQKVIFYISCGYLLKIILSLYKLIFLHEAFFSLLADSGIPWFMFVLALYNIFMYFTENISKKYLLIASVVLACFCGYDTSIGDYLYISRFVNFLPFYLAGTIVDSNKILELKKKYLSILFPTAAIIMIFFVYLCFKQLDYVYICRHLFTGRNPFADIIIPFGVLMRLLCYIITTLMCFSIIILCPNKKIAGITYMGRKTLNVYFWHWPIFLFLSRYTALNELFTMGIFGKISYLCIEIVLGIILSSLKLFDFPLKQIEAICFQKNNK